MSKKTIMLGLFGISLMLLLLCAVVQFAVYPRFMIERDKELLQAKWSVLNTDEVIDTLYEISEEMSADLAIEVFSDSGQYEIFRTERDPEFICLEGLSPERVYSTHPREGEEKLRGFFFVTDDYLRIAPLRTLKGSKTELFITTILVDFRDRTALRNALEQHGAELGAQGVFDDEFPAALFMAPLAAFFLFLIAAVFYAFSRAKDMIVKKTLGYENGDIVLTELRSLGRALLLIFVGLLLLSAVLFSLLAGLSSTLLFFRKCALPFLLFLVLALLVIAVCLNFVGARCGIGNSKGKSLDRQLYVCTLVFKLALIGALAVCLSSLFGSLGELLKLRRNTEQAAELADGYAWTSLYTLPNSKAPAYPDEYALRMYEFYHKMKETHHLIVADFDAIAWDLVNEVDGSDYRRYDATIDGSYLDTFDTVYSMNGDLIRSDQIVKDKINWLVPMDFDIERLIEDDPHFHRENYHIIRYDAAKSKFFTFSNEIEGGYASSGEIPIWVHIDNADLYMEEEDDRGRMGMLKGMIYHSVFIYDAASELSPYEQILPLLRECGLEDTLGPGTAVKQEFLRVIKDVQDRITLLAIAAFALLFALIVLAFQAAELYYRVYTREIAVKLISGYSFLDQFSLRMALKAALLPALILMPNVSIPAALCCVAVDLGLFVLCLRRNIRRNVATVMKGA